MAATLCLALLFMAVCSVEAQTTPSPSKTSSLTFYIPSLTYDATLGDTGSIAYMAMRSQIESLLNQAGGEMTELSFADGGGCLQVFIRWTGAEQLMEEIDSVQVLGISIPLSFEGCTVPPSSTSSPQSPSNELTTTTLFLSGLQYTSQLNNSNSETFVSIRTWVEALLTPTGATLEDIDFADGGGCLRMWIQTRGGDVGVLTELFTTFTRTSIDFFGSTLNVSFDECYGSSPQLPSSGLTTTTLFLSGLQYTAELNNSTSETFATMQAWVRTLLTPTGAVLEDINFANGGGCLRMWIQTRGGDIGALSQLFTTFTETGIDFLGLKVNVSFTECYGSTPSEELTTITLFLSGLFYDDDLEDPTSNDYFTIRTVVQSLLASTGAVLEDLDFADGGGCVRIWIQARGGNVRALTDLVSTLTLTGLDVLDHKINISYTECHDTLCKFFTEEVCGEHGRCRGNSAYGTEWEMCDCEDGYGGLFCQKNETDYLTECERMREFTLFIHRQITGQERQLKSMKMTMKEIMGTLKRKSYAVPYCYPSSNMSRENFYSQCDYDAKNGRETECYCLNRNGQPNYAYYHAPSDCRTYGYLAQIRGEVFIYNLDWSSDLMEDKELYTSLRSQIESHMSPAGGFLSELKLSPWGNGGCVRMHIEYRAQSRVQGLLLFHSLPGSSVMVKDENKTLSLFPCKENIDVNECPKPLPDSFSICLYECGEDTPCKEGLTCCNNSCGQGICKELGFLQKMKVNITMNIDFMSDYESENSLAYRLMEENIINAIDSLMSSNGIASYTSVKVLGFKRAKPMPRYRKRRQAIPEEYDTLVLLEVLFSEEIPVDKIMTIRGNFLESGIDFNSMNYEILSINLGQQGECGVLGECSYGSICVETLGGQHQCACPTGRGGSDCRMTVCQNPDGSSLCQNNAPCLYDEVMNGYRCRCEAGYHGKYCETNVCALLTPDACGEGSCVGFIESMDMCRCPSGKGGLFCEHNVEPYHNATLCEKHRAFASFVLSVINGSNDGSKLNGEVSQLLAFFNASRGILLLPKCRYDNPNSSGEYHYYCAYDTATGQRSAEQDCLCVNGDGSPNYWTFHNGQCVVYVQEKRKPCEGRPCVNGGVCHNMPNNDFSCTCPPGFHGRTCQRHHRDQCPHGGMPLYQSWGIWNCGDDRPCPVGFHCHGDSFNGSCCFQPDFMCDLNLCQNGASCIGDIQSGQICHCPPGKTGVFCDKDDDGVKLTQCQKQQQFMKWLERLLRTGVTPKGTTLEDMRRILIHIGVTYVPTDLCDDEGAFKSRVDSVSVLNVNDVKTLCFDEHGEFDSLCKDVICDTVQPLGICLNGGRCIGDFTHAFCDCTGTGHHGPRCDKIGEESRTLCVQVRELIHFALRIVNGSEQIVPGVDISGAVQDLFEMTQIPLVFEPFCDDYGRYAYKGCAHFLPTLESKLCYCTSEDFQQVGDAMSIVEPPERCPIGPEQCPQEWGPDCERPDWWCSHEIKCQRGEEKCYFAVECDGEECEQTPKISCVPKELKLPCEPQPCKHDKYKMCPPCGEEASCFHITRGDFDSEDKDGYDDDDDSEDKDGKDDNDSEEKHAVDKGDDDDDSHEKDLSWMKPTRGQNYICECPTGRSGPHCEVHDEICRSIPASLCQHGCIGDLENGVLCRCPESYAGVTCEKFARTKCEIEEAFFGDSLNILRGHLTVPGFQNSDLQKLVRFLVSLTGGDTIVETNCTENGFYEKVQCDVNVNDLDHKQCYCVNQRGDYIGSNIMPHIGFPVCTGPLDMRTMVGVCHQQNVQICQNGGSCVFDLYEGKICHCPHGFHGQLCERPGQPEVESQTFCEFMRDSYHYTQDILRNNRTENNVAAMYIYQIMSSFIDINSNRTAGGHPREHVGLKTECLPDGNFMPYVCDHDLLTDERIACYCLGYDGPLIGTEAPDPESLDCSEARSLDCHELDDCPYLECEHGHRHNLQYCPICECKHPCEGHKCHKRERCVVHDDDDCDKDEKCTKPVCVPMHKPGVCPRHKPEYISSIKDSLMSNTSMYNDETCQVKCHDDADCEGSKKCCGLCGNMCVEPEESDDCTHQYDIMMEYLEFIRGSRNLNLSTNTPRSLSKIVDQTDEINEIWVPSCLDSIYVPVQCMYNVSALLEGARVVTQCFCVDRLGHRVRGSVGYAGNASSCSVKPLSCPALQPSTGDDDVDECTEDLDCAKSSKCCYDGFHHVCSEPVPDPADDYVIDMIMANICDQNPDICPSGPCIPMWEKDGKVCECDEHSNMMGPFCEVPMDSESPKPRTACERKRLATYLFWLSFEKIMTTATDPKNYSTIDRLVEYAIENVLKEVPEYEREKIPVVMYECDDDGNFEPVQCDLSMYTTKKMECFCVNEDGKEIPGSRNPADEPIPRCKREEMCEMGHALHGDYGNPVTCDKDNQCPYGYTCSRGMYGKLYCCPSKEEKTDTCNHPVDMGYECDHGTPAVLYYYRADTDSCESFNFKGCGGNRNSFKSMDNCVKRCQDRMHIGSCPSTPVKVTKADDCGQNQCTTDSDCPSDRLKCCDSTCGKMCIPAIDESPAEGRCPFGPPKSEPEVCEYVSQCGTGYRCHFEDDNVASIYRKGYCCLDVENVNYCQMRPLIMEAMREDREEKDDHDDKDSSDDDDDDDEEKDDDMYEHDKRGMPCEKLKPRFYYNHEHSQCEMYHGCEVDFNTFATREDCCKTCNIERRCKEGRCPIVRPDVPVTCTDECYNDYQCQGEKICCNTGCSLSCVHPEDERNSTCFAAQREAKKTRSLSQRGNTCNAVHIPMCEENGEYARQQCLSSLGICWCVTAEGNYLASSLTRGVASCHHYSEVDMNLADTYPENVHDVEFQVCPQEEEVHCCAEKLCEKPCHAHPEAMCRMNPCGGCRAEYFDADNNIVNCEEGLTPCQLELQNALKIINARSITANMEEEENADKEEEERRRKMAAQMDNDWGTAIRTDIPLKCQKAPETGNCKGFQRRWFYNPQTRKCSMFIWGMCGGNGNRFRTPKECYDECDPPSNPCAVVRCGTPTPECSLTYDEDCYTFEGGCQLEPRCTEIETNTNLVDGVFIPRCFSSGAYNNKQCHGRFCWCVDDDGEYVGGLTSTAYYGDLQCTSSGPTVESVITLPDCPAGSYASKPRHECLKECSVKVCPGYPKAECGVDLCSESCATMFKDEYGNIVDCEEDECKAFSFETEDREHCSGGVLCDGENVRNCPSNVCEDAKERLCPKNPCAVCMVDSCTCQPYFIDVLTSERVDHDSSNCKYLSKGTCTAQTCKLTLDNVPSDQLPQCTPSGSFRAKQCRESFCYCVGAEGNFIRNVTANGNCEEIDEIAKLDVRLAFEADFDDMQRRGLLSKLREEVRNFFINEVGVPPSLLYVSEPYRGSVAVNATIQEKEDEPADANINLIGNTLSQKLQTGFNVDIDGETVGVIQDKSTFVQIPASLVDDDDDDDGLSDKEIIIIAACAGGAALLILTTIICCCCCRTKKKPEAVDDTYDHIRERSQSDKNIYDNPATMYNNKSFEAEGHYMDVQDNERYMKVRL